LEMVKNRRSQRSTTVNAITFDEIRRGDFIWKL